MQMNRLCHHNRIRGAVIARTELTDSNTGPRSRCLALAFNLTPISLIQGSQACLALILVFGSTPAFTAGTEKVLYSFAEERKSQAIEWVLRSRPE